MPASSHIRTLYLPKFLTVQVSTASRPAGYVTFDMDPWNSGSGSSPWFKSDFSVSVPNKRKKEE